MHILTPIGWKPLRTLCKLPSPDSHMVQLKPYYKPVDEWCAEIHAYIAACAARRNMPED